MIVDMKFIDLVWIDVICLFDVFFDVVLVVILLFV